MNSFPNQNYASAVQGIELEKKMVAALKRLSIGNMMSYDPDLPMQDPDLQLAARYDDSSFRSSPTSPSSPTSNSQSPLPERGQVSPRTPSPRSSPNSRRKSDLSILSRQSPPQVTKAKLDASPERYGDQDQIYDTSNSYLWVPANYHPEVDPEKFKVHVKNTVDEIMSRKQKRKSMLSGSTNTSSSHNSSPSTSLDTSAGAASSAEITTPTKHSHSPSPDDKSLLSNSGKRQSQVFSRYSNPSLRELSDELDILSQKAGMNANDTITLARTLSTHSLGYTDVERLAMDEMGSAAPYTDELESQFSQQVISPELNTMYKTSTLNRPWSGYRSNTSPNQLQPATGPHVVGAGSGTHNIPIGGVDDCFNPSPSSFALKRSRRPNYRKTSTALGSALQSTKHGKLAELRNDLTSDFGRGMNPQGPTVLRNPVQNPLLLLRSSSPSAAMSQRRRDNTPSPRKTLTHKNYHPSARRGPEESLLPQEPRSGTGSPYPTAHRNASAVKQNMVHDDPSNYPARTSGLLDPNGSAKHARHDLYPRRDASHTPHTALPPTPDKLRQYADSSGQRARHGKSLVKPLSVHDRTRQSRHDARQQVPSLHPQSLLPRLASSQTQSVHSLAAPDTIVRSESSPSAFNRNEHGPEFVLEQSHQLNQNLDMLRLEINEFKERLVKSDGTEKARDHTLEKTLDDSGIDFSFESSTRDLSFDDPFNIDESVLDTSDEKSKPAVPLKNATFYETDAPRKSLLDPKQKSLPPVLNLSGISNRETSVKPEHVSNNTRETLESNGVPKEQVASESAGVAGASSTSLVSPAESMEIFYLPEVTEFAYYSTEPSQKPSANHEKELPDPKRSFEEDSGPQRRAHSSAASIVTFDDTQLRPKKLSLSKKASLPEIPRAGAALDDNSDPLRARTGLKKKKSWLWLKERSASVSETMKELPELAARPALRLVSTPAPVTLSIPEESGPNKLLKENMISKLFKKKKTLDQSNTLPAVTVEAPPPENSLHKVSKDKKSRLFKTKKSEKSQLHGAEIATDATVATRRKKSNSSSRSRSPSSGSRHSEHNKENYALRQSATETQSHMLDVKSMEVDIIEDIDDPIEVDVPQVAHEQDAATKNLVAEKSASPQDDASASTDAAADTEVAAAAPLLAQDVQEKLKKSIRRTSKANQPLTFTDSAFGFPLPPPSPSTLIMIDYRFPLHVERAIYRLSHLKLANPKRSLREQVLLSNFMYAYLNLVDHTLHLEQQMTTPDDSPAKEVSSEAALQGADGVQNSKLDGDEPPESTPEYEMSIDDKSKKPKSESSRPTSLV